MIVENALGEGTIKIRVIGTGRGSGAMMKRRSAAYEI